MKYYTHPATAFTYIQRKDGSSYVKHWGYLRSTLILEGDSKKWETIKFRYSIDIKKIIELSQIKVEKKGQNTLPFWFNLYI